MRQPQLPFHAGRVPFGSERAGKRDQTGRALPLPLSSSGAVNDAAGPASSSLSKENSLPFKKWTRSAASRSSNKETKPAAKSSFSVDSSSWPALGASVATAAAAAPPAAAPATAGRAPLAPPSANEPDAASLLRRQMDRQQELLEAAAARAAQAERAAAAARRELERERAAAAEEWAAAEERAQQLASKLEHSQAAFQAAQQLRVAANKRAKQLESELAGVTRQLKQLNKQKQWAESEAATARAAADQQVQLVRSELQSQLASARRAAEQAAVAGAHAQHRAAAAECRAGEMQAWQQMAVLGASFNDSAWQGRALAAEAEVARLQQAMAQWGWRQQ